MLIAETCHKLDPENGQITGLVNNLRQYRNQPNALLQIQKEMTEMENAFRANPADYTNGFALASKYMTIGQNERAFQILDSLADGSNPMVAWSVVQAYAQLQNVPKAASALQRYVKLAPNQPEGWYNLAKTDIALGKTERRSRTSAGGAEINPNFEVRRSRISPC
nr:DUF2723 domain-containing protein [uncultured bacterium]